MNSEMDGRAMALALMEEMCAASEMDMRPVVRGGNPPYVEIELVGEDVAASIGRHGQTLDALQFLANTILSRRGASDARIVLDAANYRARRVETLEKLAQDYAAQVKELQQEAELDPLPAHERRIVHNALTNDPDVYTYSEGDEPDRRVVISPRK